MKRLYNNLIILILILLLLLFPLAYNEITIRWTILFIPSLFFLILSNSLIAENKDKYNYFKIIVGIIFCVILDFVEKINLIQQFNIPIDLGFRIPLSSIILSVGILLLVIRAIKEKKSLIPGHYLMKYILFCGLFLCVIMCLFYPFLRAHYNSSIEANVLLINKLIKYCFTIILVWNAYNIKYHPIILNIAAILGIGMALFLSFFV
jgi:hypothetical protein